jgi:hypothetical protein
MQAAFVAKRPSALQNAGFALVQANRLLVEDSFAQ